MRAVLVRTLNRAELLDGGSSLAWLKVRKMDFALVALLIFIMATSTFVFHVWSRLYVLRLGYEIYSQDNVKKELIEENRKLEMAIASLRSPSRLERIARDELHLRPARPDQVVVVRRSGRAVVAEGGDQLP